MTVRTALPATRRINYRVPALAYSSEVGVDGLFTTDLPAMSAANTTGLLSAQSIAAAGSTQAFAAAYSAAALDTIMSRYGRNVTVVASGAATSTVTITGYDYLGQRMVEVLTLNGTTPVLGAKMFKEIFSIAWTLTGGTTINVGWGDRLGVPFKIRSTQMLGEEVSEATPGSAGAIVAGVDAQTTTSSDPRGYYTPHSSVVANGTRTYRFTAFADRSDLHGSAHVTS